MIALLAISAGIIMGWFINYVIVRDIFEDNYLSPKTKLYLVLSSFIPFSIIVNGIFYSFYSFIVLVKDLLEEVKKGD